MLAMGAYKRVAWQTNQKTHGGLVTLVPALQWTIEPEDIKSTAQDIFKFVEGFECIWSDEHSGLFHYETANGRPQLHPVYIETRQRLSGQFGLKNFGISDECAMAMINTPDVTYVSLSQYNKTKRYGRVDPLWPCRPA